MRAQRVESAPIHSSGDVEHVLADVILAQVAHGLSEGFRRFGCERLVVFEDEVTDCQRAVDSQCYCEQTGSVRLRERSRS
jgi:hypothetical protein